MIDWVGRVGFSFLVRDEIVSFVTWSLPVGYDVCTWDMTHLHGV